MDKVREGKVVDLGLQQEKNNNPLMGLEYKPLQTEEDRRADKSLLAHHLALRKEKEFDYDMNSMLRKRFRVEKKEIEKTGLVFGDSDDKVPLARLAKEEEVSFLLTSGFGQRYHLLERQD